MAKWNASVGLQLSIDYDDIEADTQAEADANAKINSSITDQLIRMKEAEARLKHGWVTVQGSDTVVTKDADSDK